MNKAQELRNIADNFHKENTVEYKTYLDVLHFAKMAASFGKKEYLYTADNAACLTQVSSLLEKDGFVVTYIQSKDVSVNQIKVEWNDQSYSENKKITLIKINNPDYKPSVEDLNYLKECFENDTMSKATLKFGSVSVEKHFTNNDHVTLVKLGGDSYIPSASDLETWRQIFEEAKNDPDFKIFTHSEVNIEQIKVGNNTQIITSDAALVNYTKVAESTKRNFEYNY